MPPIISLNKVSKIFKAKKKTKGFVNSLKSVLKPNYQEFKAVNNISFQAEKGEIIGFIGPNGAGKSTTIKMMTGILHQTIGEIKVLGYNP